MAIYTFTTTTQQESLLTWIVGEANKQKDTAYTNEQYVTVRFPELLTPYAEAFKQHLLSQIQSNFLNADDATRAQVLQLLKVA